MKKALRTLSVHHSASMIGSAAASTIGSDLSCIWRYRRLVLNNCWLLQTADRWAGCRCVAAGMDFYRSHVPHGGWARCSTFLLKTEDGPSILFPFDPVDTTTGCGDDRVHRVCLSTRNLAVLCR